MVRENKALLPFSHSGLTISLLRACDHREDLDESVPYLCGTIEQKLYKLQFSIKEKTVTKADIVAASASVLKNYDPVAYVKYVGRYQAQLDAPTIRRALKRKK
jgi:transcriptional regulator NrdR family protein